MSQTFKDLFSGHASDYKKFRPQYPSTLFSYLATLSEEKHLAWDVGTGNGQAALELAKYFKKVMATDPSGDQLKAAEVRENITYLECGVKNEVLVNHSVDLVTVAQAFHWFPQEPFFSEIRRVAKPSAIFAIWCYELAHINPEIDKIVQKLYGEILGPYWEKERRLVEEGYRKEKVPFLEMPAPNFSMEKEWDLEAWMGYLGTWSALRKYWKQKNQDPRELIPEISSAWGNLKTVRKVQWPLSLRVFKIV